MPAHATNLFVTVDPTTGASKFLFLSGVVQSPSSTADSNPTTIDPSNSIIVPSNTLTLDSTASPSSAPAAVGLSLEQVLQQSPAVIQAALAALQATMAENRSTLEQQFQGQAPETKQAAIQAQLQPQQAFIQQLIDALRNSGVVDTGATSSLTPTAQEAEKQKRALELAKAQAAAKLAAQQAAANAPASNATPSQSEAAQKAEELQKKREQAKAQETAATQPPSNTTPAASNEVPQPTTAGSTASPGPATTATSATVLNLQQLAGLIDRTKPSSTENENAMLSVVAERAKLDDPSGGVIHSGALRRQQEEELKKKLEQAKAQATAATQPPSNTAAAASNVAPQPTTAGSTASPGPATTATPATFQDLAKAPGLAELLGHATGNDASPNASLTHAEVATTVQRGMDLSLPTPPGTPTFADTPSTSTLNDAVIAAGVMAAAKSGVATSQVPSNTPGAPSFTPLPDRPSRESLAQLAAALVAGHGTGPLSLPTLPNGVLPDWDADDVQQLLLNQHMQSPGFQALLTGSPSTPDIPPVEERPPVEQFPPYVEDRPVDKPL
jgi:hypothetical protein